ncbi:MAG: mechanosensitive ion channel domain-containing protein [Alistipes shahii]
MRLMQAYVVISVFRFINALLYAAFRIAAARPAWQNKPIKGLRQTAQGIALLICTILIVSILLDKSPAILLTGTGRLGGHADADLPRQHPRRSCRASSSRPTTCCKVGDWISVPKYGADGTVEEVSLTTVKIRNWDNTLVMLPPYLLTTDSFTNWRAHAAFGRPPRDAFGSRST